MFENPRRGKQARNFTTNVPKILDLKSSSNQIFSKNFCLVPLIFVDLQRYYKDPQRQNSLKDPHGFHEDLLTILRQSGQRSLQRPFKGSLRILKDLVRILSRILKRSLSGSSRILENIARIFKVSI